jgi:hypothetical protein
MPGRDDIDHKFGEVSEAVQDGADLRHLDPMHARTGFAAFDEGGGPYQALHRSRLNLFIPPSSSACGA